MKREPKLGEQAKDTVTGIHGTVIGTAQWLSGTHDVLIQQKGVQPQNGKAIDTQWIDAPRTVCCDEAGNEIA